MKRILQDKQSWLLALTGSYCVISVMMNYLCMKPLSFGTPFIWMDGGLLVSWIVFLISNVIVEAYSKRTAILVTAIATVVALMISIIAALEVYIPTLDDYATQAEHFRNVFSNGPRTILSSAIAFFVGNVVNVEIIARLKQHTLLHHPEKADKGRLFAFRAVLSTIIGQLVDNGLFQTLAFAPVGISVFEMHWNDIATAVGMSTLVETAIESCFIPLITLPLARYLQQINENVQHNCN